jgi:hypothetical protein
VLGRSAEDRLARHAEDDAPAATDWKSTSTLGRCRDTGGPLVTSTR